LPPATSGEDWQAQLGIKISQAEVLDLICTADVNLTSTLEFAEFEDLWAIHMVSTSDEVRADPAAGSLRPWGPTYVAWV
jgi:hypothetical protein